MKKVALVMILPVVLLAAFVLSQAPAQISGQPSGWEFMDIALGNITGVTHVNKFGRNTVVTASNEEEIWDGAVAYSFPSTPLAVKVSMKANDANLLGETVEITGIDLSWDEVTQLAELDPNNTTTHITLGTALRRVSRVRILSSSSSSQDLSVHNAADNVDYAIIKSGKNQTQMAIYSVPNGKTAYITNWYGTINPGGGAPTTAQAHLWVATNNLTPPIYARQIKHSLGLAGDVDAYGRFQHFFIPYLVVPERSDIFVTAEVAGANADVSAGFDVIVVDD